nr:hypothetical protein [Leekyejoonella antrihumi]
MQLAADLLHDLVEPGIGLVGADAVVVRIGDEVGHGVGRAGGQVEAVQVCALPAHRDLQDVVQVLQRGVAGDLQQPPDRRRRALQVHADRERLQGGRWIWQLDRAGPEVPIKDGSQAAGGDDAVGGRLLRRHPARLREGGRPAQRRSRAPS